jgi:hypothetical protein
MEGQAQRRLFLALALPMLAAVVVAETSQERRERVAQAAVETAVLCTQIPALLELLILAEAVVALAVTLLAAQAAPASSFSNTLSPSNLL